MHNDLLNCRPNDDRYAFLRPGQIQLTNLRAAGRIKDIDTVPDLPVYDRSHYG